MSTLSFSPVPHNLSHSQKTSPKPLSGLYLYLLLLVQGHYNPQHLLIFVYRKSQGGIFQPPTGATKKDFPLILPSYHFFQRVPHFSPPPPLPHKCALQRKSPGFTGNPTSILADFIVRENEERIARLEDDLQAHTNTPVLRIISLKTNLYHLLTVQWFS